MSDVADAIVECTDGEQAVAAYAVEQPWGPKCHTTAPKPRRGDGTRSRAASHGVSTVADVGYS